MGDVMAEGILKMPTQELFAVLKIVHAPAGAWTGKLTTPNTRGAFAAEGPMPSSQPGQALFRYAIDHARLGGDIPGGIVSRLHDLVQEFIRNNTGDASGDSYAKKMQPLLTRFEKKGDWKQADMVALLDDIAAVTTIPLERTLEAIRENSLQRGRVLPASLKNANWGEALPEACNWRGCSNRASILSVAIIAEVACRALQFRQRTSHLCDAEFSATQHSAALASGAALQLDSRVGRRGADPNLTACIPASVAN